MADVVHPRYVAEASTRLGGPISIVVDDAYRRMGDLSGSVLAECKSQQIARRIALAMNFLEESGR